MRYAVYNSGIGNDSGANFMFNIVDDAFNCAQQLGRFLADTQGQNSNTVVIDCRDNRRGFYNATDGSWNGELQP
jgi:hypothetical protein